MTKRPEAQFPQNWLQKMCKVCLAFLVFVILFNDSDAARRKLDCQKTPFYFKCRGITAKRSESEDFVLHPRLSINQDSGADQYISNEADGDFEEFSDDDFGSKRSSSYDLGLDSKLWPHLKRALLARTNRSPPSEVETLLKSNQAKLEKWSKVLSKLLEQQEK